MLQRCSWSRLCLGQISFVSLPKSWEGKNFYVIVSLGDERKGKSYFFSESSHFLNVLVNKFVESRQKGLHCFPYCSRILRDLISSRISFFLIDSVFFFRCFNSRQQHGVRSQMIRWYREARLKDLCLFCRHIVFSVSISLASISVLSVTIMFVLTTFQK